MGNNFDSAPKALKIKKKLKHTHKRSEVLQDTKYKIENIAEAHKNTKGKRTEYIEKKQE